MATERRFDLKGATGTIPAIVSLPDDQRGPCPLVLVGHGGGGHKSDDFVEAIKRRLLPRGVATAAIDAVGHGDRVEGDPSVPSIVATLSDPGSYATMVADWTTALDALLETGEFRADAVGYAGLSGGTLFGLPYLASDERVAAAALGACGTEGAPLLEDAPSIFAPMLRAAARRYERPVHFLLQSEDDYFLPDGGRELFAALASEDKTLVTNPGTHTEVPVAAVDQMIDWLVACLPEA